MEVVRWLRSFTECISESTSSVGALRATDDDQGVSDANPFPSNILDQRRRRGDDW